MLACVARKTCVVVALFATAVGSPADAAEVFKPEPKLVEAAKKEGEVLYYTTHIVDQIVRPLSKAFQNSVPGVQVKFVRADGTSLVVRLINEARAGRVQADVWFSDDRMTVD